MQVDDLGKYGNSIAEDAVQAELERLFADARFHATDRNKAFLRFVTKEFFEGRAEVVKAYAIAVDVFGRPCSFDPALDPIVRIEAARLRAALDRYYEAFGAPGAVRIALPRGRYTPVFSRCLAAPSEPSHVADPNVPGDDGAGMLAVEPGKMRRNNSMLAVGTAGTAVLLVAAAGSMAFAPRSEFTEKPNVFMSMQVMNDHLATEAQMMHDFLAVALSQFQTLHLQSAATDPSAAKTAAVGTVATMKPASGYNSYEILLKYYNDASERVVWWQVVSSMTGEALETGIERADASSGDAGSVRNRLVSALAQKLGAVSGVINSFEAQLTPAGMALGNICVLQAHLAVENGGYAYLAAAKDCLENTLAADPDDADANAVLAEVLIAADHASATAVSVKRALVLANRAMSLAPLSERSATAQMVSQFYSGNTNAAIAAGDLAMRINPNDAAVPAELGFMLFASGRWNDGVALANKAWQIADGPIGAAALTLALDAYRRGDFAAALRGVQQVGARTPVARLVQTAALGAMGEKSAAAASVAALRDENVNFEATFDAVVAVRRFDPELGDALKAGLAKAGAQFP